MSDTKKSAIKESQLAAGQKDKIFVMLPASKAEKAEPDEVWAKPSFNPDVGDESVENEPMRDEGKDESEW